MDLTTKDIKDCIFTIRGKQVMLDADLARLYGVQTRTLKQSVKRNMHRFPSDFMFSLTDEEISSMVSQSVIPSKQQLGGARPYVFTEQGVAMLSSTLKSETAIAINIQIMRAFISMRHFFTQNADIFQKFDTIDKKHLEYDKKFDLIFKTIEQEHITPKKGIFFDGQVFDAYRFITNIILQATQSIILIDNYIDTTTLTLLAKRKSGVKATIYTKALTGQLKLDLQKHHEQYPKIIVKELNKSHDRFLLIDEKIVYYIGASLKDAGKKWFAFGRLDHEAKNIIKNLCS